MKILMFAGGSGTRLWPLSRKAKPKQFQKILGEKTFIQTAVDALQEKFGIGNIYISAPEGFAGTIMQQLPNLPAGNLILEPATRDTLACVGYASYHLQRHFPEENILTLWPDFSMRHLDRFVEILQKANEYATLHNKIVKIDVNPFSPNPNLGYIKIGKLIENFQGVEVYEFLQQIEKPDEKTAREFLDSTHYLWHTGINVWPKGRLMELYKKYQPEVYEILTKMEEMQDKSLYEKIPKISIDYAVFQNVDASDFVEMPADLGWRDVGTWESVYEELVSEEEGTVSNTQVHTIDSERNVLYSTNGKKICAIGVKDFTIVETEDVILLAPTKETNRLKELIALLEKEDPDVL